MVGTYSFTSVRLPGRTWRKKYRVSKIRIDCFRGSGGFAHNGNEFVEHLCDSLRRSFWRMGLGRDMRLWRDGLVEILSWLAMPRFCRGEGVTASRRRSGAFGASVLVGY